MGLRESGQCRCVAKITAENQLAYNTRDDSDA